jgi:hypothetical protein
MVMNVICAKNPMKSDGDHVYILGEISKTQPDDMRAFAIRMKPYFMVKDGYFIKLFKNTDDINHMNYLDDFVRYGVIQSAVIEADSLNQMLDKFKVWLDENSVPYDHSMAPMNINQSEYVMCCDKVINRTYLLTTAGGNLKENTWVSYLSKFDHIKLKNEQSNGFYFSGMCEWDKGAQTTVPFRRGTKFDFNTTSPYIEYAVAYGDPETICKVHNMFMNWSRIVTSDNHKTSADDFAARLKDRYRKSKEKKQSQQASGIKDNQKSALRFICRNDNLTGVLEIIAYLPGVNYYLKGEFMAVKADQSDFEAIMELFSGVEQFTESLIAAVSDEMMEEPIWKVQYQTDLGLYIELLKEFEDWEDTPEKYMESFKSQIPEKFVEICKRYY